MTPSYEKNESRPVKIAFMVLAWSLRPVANLLMGKKWLNLHKLPKDSGFIVCPNHMTEIDPVVVGHMLYNNGHPPHFLAKESLFKLPLFGKVMTAAKQVPVSRSGPTAASSLTVARRVIADRGAIVIYPEGTLTRDPDLWPMTGHTGAARLALRTGAPVVPVAHWGAQYALPRYAKMIHPFPRRKVTVLIGDELDLSEYRNRPITKEILQEVTTVIMDAITELVAQLRGEPAPATRWDPAKQGSLKGAGAGSAGAGSAGAGGGSADGAAGEPASDGAAGESTTPAFPAAADTPADVSEDE